MTLEQDWNIFLLPLILIVSGIKQIFRKHSLTSTVCSFEDACDWTFSATIVKSLLMLGLYDCCNQDSRNFILIMLSLHLFSQSDCSILNEVKRKIIDCWGLSLRRAVTSCLINSYQVTCLKIRQIKHCFW